MLRSRIDSATRPMNALIICEALPERDEALRSVQAALGSGVHCHPVWSRAEFDDALANMAIYSFVLVGSDLGWTDGLSIVEELAESFPTAPVILITDSTRCDLVAAGFRAGACDFLRTSQVDRLPGVVARALEGSTTSNGSEDRLPVSPGQGARRLAFESVISEHVFSCLVHQDGRIESEWRSDGLRRILGYEVCEFEELDLEAVVHPEDRQIVHGRLRQLLDGGSPVCQYRVLTSSGEVRWLREYTRPIWDPVESRYSRFVGSAQDITEEHLSEQMRTGQIRVLELLATGSPLDRVLDEIVRLVEQSEAGAMCAIHRMNVSSGSLELACLSDSPDGFRELIASIDVAQSRQCQSAAAMGHQVVVVHDVDEDARWDDLAVAGQSMRHRSLAAIPISSGGNIVLGVLTIYRRHPGEPSPAHMQRITAAARLAGVAIEKAERERALLESRLQYQSLFDNNPHLVFSLDTRGRFQRTNPATAALTGYLEEDLIGRPFTSVLVAGELERVWRHFLQVLRGEPQQFETEIFTNRGNRIKLRVTVVPVMIDDAVVGVSGIAEDISAQVRMQEQLSYRAFHDELTGLPNRTLFNERLEHALSFGGRTRNNVAVLFVDLDNFKIINDSLGHQSGDEYLKIIARWLEDTVGPLDSVARFGGDEFLVLLVYPNDEIGYPVRVAERIGRMLNQPVILDGHEISMAISIGISIQTSADETAGDLLRHADIALYQAKRAGRGTLYRVFEDEMHQHIIERLEIERDLRRALRNDEFDVHYQPIIDLRTDEIAKVEALVRWRHPKHGLLPPGRFLPVAEETGQITEIDAWVLRRACRDIASWNAMRGGARPIMLGVNLSTRDFRQPDLPELIQDALNDSSCNPQWVEFEITESTMMQDMQTALSSLERLRALGVGFSVDDFGTGYSSLSYLQRLPLDALKIDRSFIDGLGGDEGDELMVRTIISLASSLSLEVIAEGIETPLQLQRARDLGCDLAQGYLIARPMPFDEILMMLKAGTCAYRDESVG
jgi:diguanylate cyclase (GGDEF)-like protein/PAS domain S-box-containing protein